MPYNLMYVVINLLTDGVVTLVKDIGFSDECHDSIYFYGSVLRIENGTLKDHVIVSLSRPYSQKKTSESTRSKDVAPKTVHIMKLAM